MELIGKLASNDTSNIGIILSGSIDVSTKFADQCRNNINNKENNNVLKSSTKIQKRKSLFRY